MLNPNRFRLHSAVDGILKCKVQIVMGLNIFCRKLSVNHVCNKHSSRLQYILTSVHFLTVKLFLGSENLQVN